MNTFEFFLNVLTTILAGSLAAKQAREAVNELDCKLWAEYMPTDTEGQANLCSLEAQKLHYKLCKLRGNNKRDVPALIEAAHSEIARALADLKSVKEVSQPVSELEKTIRDMTRGDFERESEAVMSNMLTKYMSDAEFCDEQREEAHEKMITVFSEFYDNEFVHSNLWAVADFETCLIMETERDGYQQAISSKMLNLRRLRGAVHTFAEAAKLQREAATVTTCCVEKPREIEVAQVSGAVTQDEQIIYNNHVVVAGVAAFNGDAGQAIDELCALLVDRKYATAMSLIKRYELGEDELIEAQEYIEQDTDVLVGEDEYGYYIVNSCGEALVDDELNDDELMELAEATEEIPEPEFEPEQQRVIIKINVYNTVYFACKLASGLDYWSGDRNLAHRFDSEGEVCDHVQNKQEYITNQWVMEFCDTECVTMPQPELAMNIETAKTMNELYAAEPAIEAVHKRALLAGVFMANDVPTIREMYKLSIDTKLCRDRVISSVRELTFSGGATLKEVISEIGAHYWYGVAGNFLQEEWFIELDGELNRIRNASRKCRAVEILRKIQKNL